MIIEERTKRELSGANARLPFVSLATLASVSLTLIALMCHVLAHMSRLIEMAGEHHRRMLGFPWILTMNSRWVRWGSNLFVFAAVATGPPGWERPR